MSKKIILIVGLGALVSATVAFAFESRETGRYFNGPTVTEVTDTTATVSLSEAVLAGITLDERNGVYFEYDETGKMCIMIYPTPAECLPKVTEKGKTTITLSNLKPNTEYRVLYKHDNTIQCITTPCPGNEFESLTAIFTTKKGNEVAGRKNIERNVRMGTRGEIVRMLQEILKERGYFTGSPTGYFGPQTLRSVKEFQRANNISPTGFVGELTRRALSSMASPVEPVVTETFEGLVTAYSTACFADGECSISVDGKKVVTTIGWSRDTVGKVTGIPDFGSIENHIGARAKVYAKKTTDGYTLYGDEKYYVQINAKSSSDARPSPAMSFFITSKNKGNGADFGGILGADAHCKELAENVGIRNKTWVAYLSTSGNSGTPGINAKDRIGNGPWYNYNGELIAQNPTELHGNNNLNKKTALTEKGEIVLGRGDSINVHDILTGSNEFGMSVATTTDTTCRNWTSSDTGSAYVGHHDRIGINDSAPMKSWVSSHLSRGCSLEALRASGGGGLLYCFAK